VRRVSQGEEYDGRSPAHRRRAEEGAHGYFETQAAAMTLRAMVKSQLYVAIIGTLSQRQRVLDTLGLIAAAP
jgi:hypothetical protein